jgi:hypothetical protein
MSPDDYSKLIGMYQSIAEGKNNKDKAEEIITLIYKIKQTKAPLSGIDEDFLNQIINTLTNKDVNLSHKLHGGKRYRRTYRKRILNKNMKPMHKSMHRGRSGKRRSYRKY